MMAPCIHVEIESFEVYQEIFNGIRDNGVNVLFNKETWEQDKARICNNSSKVTCEWPDQFYHPLIQASPIKSFEQYFQNRLEGRFQEYADDYIM